MFSSYRICLRGECHKCHICHIGNEKFKKHTTIPTTKSFSEKLKIILLYNRGLYGRYRSAD